EGVTWQGVRVRGRARLGSSQQVGLRAADLADGVELGLRGIMPGHDPAPQVGHVERRGAVTGTMRHADDGEQVGIVLAGHRLAVALQPVSRNGIGWPCEDRACRRPVYTLWASVASVPLVTLVALGTSVAGVSLVALGTSVA